MKSEHIDNRKLYDVATADAILDPNEIEHLQTCDECMELIRVYVRQYILKNKS